jgi:hypothetical protein
MLLKLNKAEYSKKKKKEKRIILQREEGIMRKDTLEGNLHNDKYGYGV